MIEGPVVRVDEPLVEESLEQSDSTQRKGAMATDKNVDEGRGRLKEAAGSLTSDESLKREGKADQAKASVKDKIDKATEKVKDVLDGDRK
jgi:uncharacterized protein YjbJ (UPF0337 family)